MLTKKELAEALNTTPLFIHNRIKDGTIPAVKISGIVRIRIEDVEDLLRHSQIVPPRDLNPDDRAFIAELVANAPALSESQKDTIHAAFRETSRAAT
jgi:excisionase family DNA binding protein